MVPLQGPLDGSGYGYCALTVDGQAAIKTGNVAGSLTGVRVAQRRTIEGSSCRLPVVYQCVDLPLSLPVTSADTVLLSHLQVKSTSWSSPAY